MISIMIYLNELRRDDNILDFAINVGMHSNENADKVAIMA